jgi:hypothetical protein
MLIDSDTIAVIGIGKGDAHDGTITFGITPSLPIQNSAGANVWQAFREAVTN